MYILINQSLYYNSGNDTMAALQILFYLNLMIQCMFYFTKIFMNLTLIYFLFIKSKAMLILEVHPFINGCQFYKESLFLTYYFVHKITYYFNVNSIDIFIVHFVI